MAVGDLVEQIRRRAYEIWLNEGCPHGRDHIHWLRAEAEFREKLAAVHSNSSQGSGLHETPTNRVSGQQQRDNRTKGAHRKERKR